MKVLSGELAEVVLDTNQLEISKVEMVAPEQRSLTFSKDATKGDLGEALRIQLGSKAPSDFTLRISYSTAAKAAATNWVEESETQGGKLPYMYTQCQPIACRSLAPMQDTVA